MAILNSYVKLPEGNFMLNPHWDPIEISGPRDLRAFITLLLARDGRLRGTGLGDRW